MRFLGNIEAKTDAKGRAFLPAVFRKVLQASGEERLVAQLVHLLYPESVWNVQMDELRNKLSRWNKREQQIFRMFVSDVEILSLDGNGRFLIPKRYMKMADIDQNIKFVGVDNTIEIWSNDRSEPFMEPEEFSSALEEIMNNDYQQAERD